MYKILILSSFPAPYRVSVFKLLADKYKVDVFFSTNIDQNRDSRWFTNNEQFKFWIIDKPTGKQQFKKAIRELEKYDLVLAYDWYLKFAIYTILKSIIYKVPYIINCDGAFINKCLIKDKVKKIIISHATACMASGKYARDYFIHYGAMKDRIFLHNFTSLYKNEISSKPYTLNEKTMIRKKLNLPNKKIVLTIGQFIYRKGIDRLLEVWKSVLPEAHLVILGGGGEEKKYQNYIKTNKLNNISIIGYKPKNIVSEYYKASDIYVMPTREDIWGLVINEAMAHGLSIISTDMCIAALELVTNDENGYIIPNDDISKFAEYINRLLSDEELNRKISENNIKAIKNYNIENVVENHIRVIDGVLNESKY